MVLTHNSFNTIVRALNLPTTVVASVLYPKTRYPMQQIRAAIREGRELPDYMQTRISLMGGIYRPDDKSISIDPCASIIWGKEVYVLVDKGLIVEFSLVERLQTTLNESHTLRVEAIFNLLKNTQD